MKALKNKKGFTLVELLAVIVILALIMSIAIVSMTGIMQGARESTFKDTAVQIINGVRNQLTLSMETVNTPMSDYESTNGVDYFFEKSIIEKGGETSPLGGSISYLTNVTARTGTLTTDPTYTYSGSIGGSTSNLKKIGSMGVYRSKTNGTCGATSISFVRVKKGASGNLEYSICLTAGSGNRFINMGTEAALLGSDTSMIATPTNG